MSDKEIVERSSLIDYLLPGDTIIADRGFRCDEYAHMALAEIKIPPFTKGKKTVRKSIQNNWAVARDTVTLPQSYFVDTIYFSYQYFYLTPSFSPQAFIDETSGKLLDDLHKTIKVHSGKKDAEKVIKVKL